MSNTRVKKQLLTVGMTILVVVGTVLSAMAVGNYLSLFNTQYGTTGTKLNSCNLCHPGGNTGQLNPYANDYAANSHNFTMIEQLDSDGDGFTNVEEITAGTFPGDPSDSPGAPPPQPNISCTPAEGTIGTEILCTGSGFGTAKGKVVLGNAFAKIAKDAWTDTSILSTMKAMVSTGTHDVIIYPQPYGSASPITLSGGFTIKDPALDPLLVDNGIPGTSITITGKFYSTRKGKVYLEDQTNGKKKTCKVTDWYMDPTTGISTVTFVVPKTSKTFLPGSYLLTVTNKVGTGQTYFTVNP